MELFWFLAVGFLISVICSVWCAKRPIDKGYNPALWGVLGFVIPIISVIVMAFLPQSDRAA